MITWKSVMRLINGNYTNTASNVLNCPTVPKQLPVDGVPNKYTDSSYVD